MRILIIGPSWLGDMIMSQALYKQIKLTTPNAIIDVLAPDWCRAVLQFMPEVSGILTMPFKHGELNLAGRYKLGKDLRCNNYDRAIILPNSFKSALVSFWASIPRRIGWLGEWRFGLLNDIRYLDKAKLTRMVDRYVALSFDKNDNMATARTDIVPQLSISQEYIDSVFAKLMLSRVKTSKRKILALAPGAAFGGAKCWPIEYYLDLAVSKIREGWQVWLFGSAQDAKITNQIASKLLLAHNDSCYDFAGKIDLAQTVALIASIDLMVSNDSGLMHLAASLDKPIVVIYGPTDPNYTPPLGKRAKILYLNLACSPCAKRSCPLKHHQCMRGIVPGMVLEAMNSL